jgi:23S rRNA-/tRNA-specific pseudouridylate synthase
MRGGRVGGPGLIGASEVPVVYRDEHLLVLDKPVGIATTSPDGGPCLVALAKEIDPSAPRLHALSRLDTQVSGIVTFARTERANLWAMDARMRGELWRRYLGITSQQPQGAEGEYHFSIGIDPRDPRRRRALAPNATGEGVQRAFTRYRVRALAGPLVALDLYPQTGRTHQLRVHTSAAGCALAGDVAYGGIKRLTLPNGRVLTAGRVMLHCAYFRMPRPEGNGLLELSLAPASDMQNLWRSAGGDALVLSEEPNPGT